MRFLGFAERLLEEPVEVSANPSTRERKNPSVVLRADDIGKTKLLVNPAATAGSHPRIVVCVSVSARACRAGYWLREAGINTCWQEEGEMVQAKAKRSY